MSYHDQLQPDRIYHIFNRAHGKEAMFRETTNYKYFLQKYAQHIVPIADTFAYNLIPNHFHFMLRIKPFKHIADWYEKMKCRPLREPNLIPRFLMQQFSNWQNGYAKAYNRMYERKGGLFMRSLKRVEIMSDMQFCSTIFYVHKNSVHHGLTKDLARWRWSSYARSIPDIPIDRQEIINFFGSEAEFKRFHEQPISLKTTKHIHAMPQLAQLVAP
jgi:putative transposase